jgi:hypothetical protein
MTWFGSGYLTGTVGSQWPGDTGANTNYVNLWRTAYSDMIRSKAQAMDSVLQPSVQPEMIEGRTLVIDAWKAVFLDQRSRGQQYGKYTTGGDKNYAETLTERRQVQTQFWEYAELFDQRDEVALMRTLRPDGMYARNVVAAFNRKKDETIITAFDATVNLYDSGTVGFDDTNNTIADTFTSTGAASLRGLDVEKLIEANRILKSNPGNQGFGFSTDGTVGGMNNDGEWHCALHPNQLADLLNITEATSADYNVVRALVTGEINTYMGFTFHQTPLIPAQGSGAFMTSEDGRYVYCYHRDALVFGMSRDFTIRFDEIPMRGYAIQAFHEFGVAAMRLDEGKIVRIECVD